MEILMFISLVLLALYVTWFLVLAGVMTWKLGAKGIEIDLEDVIRAQMRQAWKVLTLPFAVMKRRKARLKAAK
jgi:hypothetical protein